MRSSTIEEEILVPPSPSVFKILGGGFFELVWEINFFVLVWKHSLYQYVASIMCLLFPEEGLTPKIWKIQS